MYNKFNIDRCCLFLLLIIFFCSVLAFSSESVNSIRKNPIKYKKIWKKIQGQMKEKKNLATQENSLIFEETVNKILCPEAKKYCGWERNIIQVLSKPYLTFTDINQKNKQTIAVAMALIFLRKNQKSAKILDGVLKTDPSNFGALLLSGCLSITEAQSNSCTSMNWTKAYNKNPIITLYCSEIVLSHIELTHSQDKKRANEFYLVMFESMKNNKSWWEKDIKNIYQVKYFVDRQLFQKIMHYELLKAGTYRNSKLLQSSINKLKHDKIFSAIKNLNMGLECQLKFNAGASDFVCKMTARNVHDIILIVSGVLPQTLTINLSEP